MPRRRRISPEQPSEVSEVPQGPLMVQLDLKGPPRWINIRECPILYADQLTVQFMNGQFVVTLGHTEAPQLQEITEEERQKVENEGIEIAAISRFAINPQALTRMVQVLERVSKRIDDEIGDASS